MNARRYLLFRQIFVLLSLLLPGWGLEAQGQSMKPFGSQRLKEIAMTLQAEYRIDCRKPQVCAFGGSELVVRENALRSIDHIGFRIFSEKLMAENPSPVYRFVERYLLELYLMEEPAERARKLAEDKVTLKCGKGKGEREDAALAKILPKLARASSVIILTDNRYYSVSFYQASEALFSIRFPIRYELLWGMNKKEAENTFYEDLLHFRVGRQAVTARNMPEDGSLLVAINDSCFMEKGETYLIDAMNANRYYRRTPHGKYLPLRDMAYVEESIRNLFLLPTDEHITVSVTLHLYNRRKIIFETPLVQLLAFCRETGCRTFVGIESSEEQRVSGTVVLENASYGYCHQLHFATDTGILAEAGGHKMDADLYVYVPTHNVSDLYADREQKPIITNK